MAFIPTFSRTLPSVTSPSSLSSRTSFSPLRLPIRPATTRRVTVRPVSGPRMEVPWEGHPPSEVLGLGKDVPSFLYLFMSVVALGLGSYSCYMSNIFGKLSAETVNPQFIVGSLLVPISWGLHVAGWIQKENDK